MPTTGLRRSAALALTLALTATLAACGAQGPDGEADQEIASTAVEDPTDAVEQPSDHLTQADSPLEQELGQTLAQIYGDRERDATAIKNAQQEFIATCMAEQGFDYIPIVYTEDGTAEPGASLSELEWAAQYGYGYATWDLIEADRTAHDGEEAAVEPNADTVAAMSEAERHAWNMALYRWDEATGDEVPEDAPADERGCNVQADAAFREDQDPGAMTQVMADPRFAELFEASMAIGDAPAVVAAQEAADADWSECMAGAGYPDLEAPWAADELAMSQPWTPEEAYADDGAVSEATAQQILEAQQSEIALAVADETCQIEVDHDNRLYEARFAEERTFLDAYHDDIEALKLAVAEASQ